MRLPRFHKSFQRLVLAVLIPSFAMVGGPLGANPAGPDVVAGSVNFQGLGTPTLDINNFSQHAIINWQSFSIDQGEVTRINQAANAATLNRVVTGAPSEIHGRLEASNGSVFLLNPNGILVGQGGVIDVGGMLALSTLDVSDDEFRSSGAKRFFGNTQTGVTNFGTISSAAGDVVLMGGFVENKGEGQIGALNGTVAIGSGGDILLHEGGGTRISVRGESDYTGTGIDNEGTIQGASVEMKSHGNVYALAINNGGAVRATGATRSNGRVRLMSSGGSSNINLGVGSSIVAQAGQDGGSVEIDAGVGRVAIGGNLDASGAGEGGAVSVTARLVEQSAHSAVDVSGGEKGGTVALDASERLTLSGAVVATGEEGDGGDIAITSRAILLNDGAVLSADGSVAGGRIRVGGDLQGRDTGLREADSVWVESGVKLSADSFGGDAGTVIVWANKDTLFLGDVSASAKGSLGSGGFVEVSGKQFLYFDGSANVSSVNGVAGTVLFDPGDVIIGAPIPLGETFPFVSPVVGIGGPPTSLVSIRAINETLQSGANVLVLTQDGNIIFNTVAGGGAQLTGVGHDRHAAIQWTNSKSSFGAFAGGSIAVGNHIRTSGAGSVNLLAGWGGSESDTFLADLDFTAPGAVQAAWDHYVSLGQYGMNGGSVFVGSSGMAQHVEVGSRFGDTNVAGFEIRVTGSDTNATLRYAQIGFHDGGQAFAPRLDRGAGVVLDLIDENGFWYLSDGQNNTFTMPVAGVGDPIVAIVGNAYGQEVDINGDGIADGVRGINSTGVLDDTFIPYASHFNSAISGNWWWQQIEQGATYDANNNLVTAGSPETKDPLGLGGLRPEHGAGIGNLSTIAIQTLIEAELNGVNLDGFHFNGAHINVIAKANVLVQGGAGQESTGAMIGHGGINRLNSGGAGTSIRETGNETVGDVNFSNAGNERGQIERRWSFNGTTADRTGTAIGRLAPVYGNINVIAGANPNAEIVVDRATGTVAAFDKVTGNPTSLTSGGGGNVTVRANQNFKTASSAASSAAHIGHGGVGQFGEFYGDIHVEAGGSIFLLAGEGTRSFASIGHTVVGLSYWNPPSNTDQQLRFFATAGDFDNPNLRRGELFSGFVTTGFDPTLDPVRNRRYSLADYTLNGALGSYSITEASGNTGNFVPEIDADGNLTGNFVNLNIPTHIIPINPALYTRGLAGAGTQSQGVNAMAPLELSKFIEGISIPIAALDGSIVNGFHGNIKVVAKTGNITLQGYSTPEGLSGSLPRERRFAAIGHGGGNNEVNTLGAGFQNIISGAPSVPGSALFPADEGYAPDGRELVHYHTGGTNGETSGSRSEYGAGGANTNRSSVFMSITGDVDVFAGRDISMVAGNDIYDYTRIGHGGTGLADHETSSFILGDVQVHAGRHLTITGGGGIQPVNRGHLTVGGQRNYDVRAWSQIGHGGFNTGFYGFIGDIDVFAGGNILMQGGAHSHSYAKIGHQGVVDRGQSGGDVIREENFRADGVSSDVSTALTADGAVVVYASGNGGVTGQREFLAGTLVGDSVNTADIRVVAGGSITLEHLPMGERQPQARIDWLNPAVEDLPIQYNPESQVQGVRTRDSFVQIGHGGITPHSLNVNNLAANYQDKIGDITVIALGGDIILTNGEGEHRWTRIGHGVGRNNRVSANDNTYIGYSRAIELAGNITVRALSGDIHINAAAAADDESAKLGNNNSSFGSTASRYNPVVIGHGGIDNNLGVVVLGKGEDVNGIAASSDIFLTAGGNLEIRGGSGVEASFAQLGHGFGSDQGNDFAFRMGVHTGFSGNINVHVDGDILVKAGDNAWTAQPSGSTDDIGRSVTGAFAAIGNGGYQIDAPSWGSINVYAGGNLNIIAQVRTDPFTDAAGVAGVYVLRNPTVGSGAIASVYNFAKIGHFSVENGNIIPQNFNDSVDNAGQTGDITVVVGGDLRIEGGRIAPPELDEGVPIFDVEGLTFIDTRTIYGAFAQIGHGGPGIAGDLIGNITVLVKGDIAVIQGAHPGEPGVDSLAGTAALNNYAMIGNGEFAKDVSAASSGNVFRREGQGWRIGDIVVAAGGSAVFDGALIGHADPATSSQLTFGNTLIAVSRNNPFYGGTGTISAINGSVFSSGGFGINFQMEVYVPSRSNNLISNTTRINEKTATFVEAPADFAPPFVPANEKLAGRDDEVYLTPDLWWDNLGLAAAAGFVGGGVFPDSAVFGEQGGAIANVKSPGGIPNLVSLVEGSLGSSATIYRDGNGVSGAGRYTLYYDAIEAVSMVFPPPPAPPFDWTLFNNKFEVFDRENRFLRDGITGGGDDLYGSLEYDETESDDERREKAKNRARKGGPIGLTYYIFEPGTNDYSSYRVFGRPASSIPPIQ